MSMISDIRLKALIVFACSVLLAGCAGETAETATERADDAATGQAAPLPTEEEAAKIIQKAPAYSDYRFTSVTLSIPMNEERMHEQMRAYAKDLETAGWIRIDSTGTVVLSDKARKDNRWVERTNGFTDIAPLASKEFVEVRSIEQDAAGNAKVDFTYRWNQNSTGAALQSGLLRQTLDSPQYATATLEQHGDGWELYIIRSDETPPTSAPDPAAEAEQGVE